MHQKFFHLLQQDHQQILQLLKALAASPTPEERKHLLNRVHQEMLPHLIAEEETLYPALHEGRQDPELVSLLKSDHHTARMALDELFENISSKEELAAQLGRLRETIRLHMAKEEQHFFREFRKKVPATTAGQVLARFQEEKLRSN